MDTCPGWERSNFDLVVSTTRSWPDCSYSRTSTAASLELGWLDLRSSSLKGPVETVKSRYSQIGFTTSVLRKPLNADPGPFRQILEHKSWHRIETHDGRRTEDDDSS